MAHVINRDGVTTIQAVNPQDLETDRRTRGKDAAFEGFAGLLEINGTEGGVRITSGIQTFDGSNLPSANEGFILSTAQTINGSKINDMTQIGPDTLVEIGGTKCTVEIACRMGLLQRKADGQYIDTTAGQWREARKAQSKAPEPSKAQQRVEAGMSPVQDGSDYLSPTVAKTFTIMRSALGTQAADVAVGKAIIEAVEADDVTVPTRASGELAAALGVEPAAVQPLVNQAIYDLVSAAARDITSGSNGRIDGNAVMNWLMESGGMDPSFRAQVIKGLYLGGRQSVLQHLVSRYRQNAKY
jgi:hypothetical protein